MWRHGCSICGIERSAVHWMDQVQVSLRPDHGDIEKAPLFIDLFRAVR